MKEKEFFVAAALIVAAFVIGYLYIVLFSIL